jgi:hypothetical protein
MKMSNIASPWRYDAIRGDAQTRSGPRRNHRIYCARAPSIYLKNEMQDDMPWRVEILNETVATEIVISELRRLPHAHSRAIKSP